VALPEPSESATALVTGASAGIGEAMARELASRGHGVTLVARRGERLRTLAGELSERHGIRAQAIDVDLGDAPAREQLAARIAELGLEVEVLVNNAGFGGSGNVAASKREQLLAMLRVNCEALLDLQARYLPPMVERGRGAVINVASTAAFQPIPGTATYAATKAFVLSLSEGVHEELKGTGVTLTAVCPGPVKTEFTQVAGIAHAEEQLPSMFWMESQAVAKAAVDGAEHGRRVIVPGILNRAGAVTGQHTPRMLALPIVKRIWRQAL
jgi:short-subunit dehydrogenase